jgi:glycosyltransferase involved in cell wall biosynthesis
MPTYPDIRLSFPARRRVRYFLDGFRPDLIHVATEGPLGFVGRGYAIRNEMPLVTSFHTAFPRYCHDYGAPRLESLAWKWVLWFHRESQLVHTPGSEWKTRLGDRGLDRVVVWGRGVDSRHFTPERRSNQWRSVNGIADDATVVLHVGRLAREKNIDVLLDAFAKARDYLGEKAVFVIAGNGPRAEDVSRRAPFVRQFGFLDRTTLANLYANSDLCVLPSTTETCGLVALEAMASGTPVVAARAGGFLDTVRAGVNGLFAEPDDPVTLAGGIASLVNNPAERKSLSHGARRFAAKRDIQFENELLLKQYELIIWQWERTANVA